MKAEEYLTHFLVWHKNYPNEPFRDWSGLVRAIEIVLSDNEALRSLIGKQITEEEINEP